MPRTLLRLIGAMQLYNAQIRRRLELGSSDLEALISLWTAGPCSLSALARRVDLSRAAITTLADRLEHRGLLARHPDPRDGRVTVVHSTDVFDVSFAEATAELRRALHTVAADAGDGSDEFGPQLARIRRAALHEAAHLKSQHAGRRVDDEIATHFGGTDSGGP